MAEKPLFLADNFYDDLLNTSHVVTAQEEASGHEVYHVANARRSVDDYWTGTSTNTTLTVTVDCAVAKAANCVAVDRGHNLGGVDVQVEYSSDAVTWSLATTATVPSSSTASTDIDAASGAYTEEGAWVKRFSAQSARYWRFYIAAVVGFTPRLVGLSLGKAWAPGVFLDRPFDEDASVGAWSAASNDHGWSAYSSVASPRQGDLSLRIDSFDDTFARAFLDIYRRGKPVWFIPDPTKTERAMLIKAPAGARIAAPYEAGWAYRTVRLPYVEHEPELA